jgi:hypothetical protein
LTPFFTSHIVQVLEFIGKKENLHLPAGFVARIAAQSNHNIRDGNTVLWDLQSATVSFCAYLLSSVLLICHTSTFTVMLIFLSCQHCCHILSSLAFRYPFTSNQVLTPLDWKQYYLCVWNSNWYTQKRKPKRFELCWMKYFAYLLAYFRNTSNLSSIQCLCIMHPLLNQSRFEFTVISTLYLCMLLAKWYAEAYLQLLVVTQSNSLWFRWNLRVWLALLISTVLCTCMW